MKLLKRIKNYIKRLVNWFLFLLNKEKKMSQASLESVVSSIIETFCLSDKLFTSLDVSNEVKKQLLSVRHREVAPIVRQNYEHNAFDYNRTLIDVSLSNGQTAQAFLYHPYECSPDEYDATSQVAVPPVRSIQTLEEAVSNPAPMKTLDQVVSQGTHQASQPAAQSDTISDAKDVAKRTDYRVEVPASWVKNIGWRHGETVYAVGDVDAGYLSLKKACDVALNDTVLGAFFVNNGRIIVPRNILRKAGLDSHVAVCMMLCGDTVSLEA